MNRNDSSSDHTERGGESRILQLARTTLQEANKKIQMNAYLAGALNVTCFSFMREDHCGKVLRRSHYKLLGFLDASVDFFSADIINSTPIF